MRRLSHVRSLSSSASPSLNSLLRAAADGPDAPVAAAAASFTLAAAPARAASLASLHAAAAGAHPALVSAFSRVAAGAPSALPFFRAVREACGAGGGAPWGRAVDAAALAALRPLYGPAFTPLVQLELDSPSPAMRALAAAAAAAEVVRPAGAGDGARVKLGWRRAVFALHHAAEPDRLLAAVYTALLSGGPPRSLAALDAASGGAGPGRTGSPPPPGARAWALRDLDARPAPADTAVFYSVGTGAAGALGKGLRLGTRLIYGAAGAVAAGAPAVQRFCTLSPMPDFLAWLAREAAAGGGGGGGGGSGGNSALGAALARAEAAAGGGAAAALRRAGAPEGGGLAGGVCALLLAPPPWRWAASEPLLRRLALEAGRHHLLQGGAGGGPGCRVAAFHFGNGAALGRVCGGADGTAAGLQRSGGLMANYVYSEAGAEGLRVTMEERAAAFREDPLAAVAAAVAKRPVALEWEGCPDAQG
jgi:malonyl-CoA decarboxylase